MSNQEERVIIDESNIYTAKRVCYLCLKEFSSSKALGGHMRIHYVPKENKGDGRGVIVVAEEHNCVVCGKDFLSRKSLYGHMRSHPGRGWKGVHPPSCYSSSYNSMSSYDGCEEKSVAAVDLTASLKGWPVTAERGRRATEEEVSSSTVDVELMDAVNYLLMLSGGDDLVKEKKTPVGNERNDDDRKSDRHRLCDGEFESSSSTNKRRRLKKRKKVKLSKLEMSENVVVSPPGASKKYKCDMCDRCFSSHQAYGGHRSSHNKVKAFVRNSSPGRPTERNSTEPSCS